LLLKFLLKIQYSIILTCVLFFAYPLHAQLQLEQSETEHSDAIAVLYQIKLSRLQRLLKNETNSPQSSEITPDIQSLVKEGILFAEQGLYDLAVEFLDNAMALLKPVSVEPSNEPVPAEKVSGTQWDYAAFGGSEIWQQEFGLILADNDSTLVESESNPFVGFLILLDQIKNADTQTQWQFEGKLSDEYVSTQLFLDYYKRLSGAGNMKIRNSFEGTSYKNQSDLRFIDDRLDTDLYLNVRPGFLLGLANEMQYRRYQTQSLYFSNYFQNRAGLNATFTLKNYTRVEFTFEHRLLKYGFEELRDYDELTYGLNIWPDFSGQFLLNSRLRTRTREYKFGYVDSLFTNNFNEFYGFVDVGYQFKNRMELNCEFEFEKRNYGFISTSMPDYTDYNIEPSLAFGIGSFITMNAGYRFRSKQHNLDTTEDLSAQIEDFYSHGPVFTLDMYLEGGFLASVSNSYLLRRYPHYSSYDYSGLSLYSNRDIHSLFFYLNWGITGHWEINVMSMLDYDRDKSLENGDTNSNLVNFKLSYNF